jgi:4-alpha-glucanotransferase
MNKRGSGILLHLTSLPSPFGIGDLGPWAYRFVDFLADARQKYWQCLPLNPTEIEYVNSPYHSTSAFACNPLLISPELMVQDGLLNPRDLEPLAAFSDARVDFRPVVEFKARLFAKAYDQFRKGRSSDEFVSFCQEEASWLDDFALFVALKSRYVGRAWSDWPLEVRDRHNQVLQSAKRDLQERIENEKFLQYLFFRQWMALKGFCNKRGIRIIGDMPIYVVHDSVDVWVHPRLFHLDDEKKPSAVSGVPPDYFSETGQLWGNPVYRWDVLKETRYEWWVDRVRHNMKLFDLVRVDHFRGFMAYWEIPATEQNAIRGKWVKAPGQDFFQSLSERIPSLRIVAEDLGTITPDVWEVMDHFGFPGMKVLLFAFGEGLPTNPYAPHNHVKNCVVYTGTHDNNTAIGWYKKETSQEDRNRMSRYLGREVTAENVHREMIRLAMMSVADTAIIPMQDLLGLGEEARMNQPARKTGNWGWRLLPQQLTESIKNELLEMTEIYGRGL